MNNIESKSKPALGFLTVVHHPQYGLFGGYLILNVAGRPLEFHCTAPIKPNRAQEILYGPTLESFLYGEQIGQALVGHASITPLLVCTDKEPALAAREYIATPVVLVLPSPAQAIEQDQRLATFALGRNRLALPEGAEDDRRLVAERLGALSESFDLTEPFGRIRAAIEEAQPRER